MLKVFNISRLHYLKGQKSLFQQQIRCSSQLYPTTSQRWDDAMVQAESIVGDSSNFSNLQHWVSGEFNNITKYLQKLIGTNHPMLETAKRCTYISEGKMGSAQARGLTVMLTAKAIEPLAAYSCPDKSRDELIKSQISLAEMTEMTYSAYMIHRGVMDLRMHGLEAVDYKGQPGTPKDDHHHHHGQQLFMNAEQAKGIHYGNKVSVLCGDFLLAYVMRGLGDLFSSKVVDLVASAITQFMEGEFMLIDDWRANNYLMSEEARDLARWHRRSYSTIGSLQGNTCQAALVLANIDGRLQRDARELGRNIGLAWQAHTELQPFLRSTYEPIELPEMPAYPAFDLNCLPMLLFLREAHKSSKNFRLLVNDIKGGDENAKSKDWQVSSMNQHRHQETVDYEKCHRLILDQGHAVEETYKIIRSHSEKAIRHLESFPPSEAKEVLINICESLYKRE